MQALRVPARRGFEWITEGCRLFARNPLVIIMLIFGYLFLLAAAASLHFFGTCVMAVLLPAFSVGLLGAFRRVDKGDPIPFQQLFAGFGTNFPALMRLGFFYLGGLLASLALSSLVDDGLYFKYVVLRELPPENSAMQIALAQEVFVLALFPALVGIWFAPMLAAWHRLPASQSLFFGVVACLRNFRAFMVFIGALFVICFVAAVLVASLAQIADAAKAELAAILLVPIVVFLVATVTAVNYLSYRDIFRDDAAVRAAP
jgi:hypothetical protein